jgi:hypothetical protein
VRLGRNAGLHDWYAEVMKAQRAVFVFMLVVFGLTTASLTQTVTTDYDRNANFSRCKTYSWTKVETKSPTAARLL